jgi:hypothetical protein
MSRTPSPEPVCPVRADLLSSTAELVVNQVQRWSEQCQGFLEWQRRHVLAAEAADDVHGRHELALKRLLATGRILGAATSAVDFPDRRAASLVKARLAQLEECWQVTHPTMSPGEAEALLAG